MRLQPTTESTIHTSYSPGANAHLEVKVLATLNSQLSVQLLRNILICFGFAAVSVLGGQIELNSYASGGSEPANQWNNEYPNIPCLEPNESSEQLLNQSPLPSIAE